jgi:hypothetical protein
MAVSGGIVLVALDVGFHVLGQHQPNLTCPVMRRGTRFHAHQTRRQRLEERYHLAAPQLLPDDHLLVRVDAVNLKDVLGEIKTNRANLHVDGPLIVIYGTSMPGAGAVHYINCEHQCSRVQPSLAAPGAPLVAFGFSHLTGISNLQRAPSAVSSKSTVPPSS